MVDRGTGPPADLCALSGAAVGCLNTECEKGSAVTAPLPARTTVTERHVAGMFGSVVFFSDDAMHARQLYTLLS